MGCMGRVLDASSLPDLPSRIKVLPDIGYQIPLSEASFPAAGYGMTHMDMGCSGYPRGERFALDARLETEIYTANAQLFIRPAWNTKHERNNEQSQKL